ncbi:hypothetical protein H9P43_006051 [Blastocladiella emersonii ATCC 22665]|nr:hypothetical protein H9P43_006051 [Blastocladiella emersonii ATCC 22665]
MVFALLAFQAMFSVSTVAAVAPLLAVGNATLAVAAAAANVSVAVSVSLPALCLLVPAPLGAVPACIPAPPKPIAPAPAVYNSTDLAVIVPAPAMRHTKPAAAAVVVDPFIDRYAPFFVIGPIRPRKPEKSPRAMLGVSEATLLWYQYRARFPLGHNYELTSPSQLEWATIKCKSDWTCFRQSDTTRPAYTIIDLLRRRLPRPTPAPTATTADLEATFPAPVAQPITTRIAVDGVPDPVPTSLVAATIPEPAAVVLNAIPIVLDAGSGVCRALTPVERKAYALLYAAADPVRQHVLGNTFRQVKLNISFPRHVAFAFTGVVTLLLATSIVFRYYRVFTTASRHVYAVEESIEIEIEIEAKAKVKKSGRTETTSLGLFLRYMLTIVAAIWDQYGRAPAGMLGGAATFMARRVSATIVCMLNKALNVHMEKGSGHMYTIKAGTDNATIIYGSHQLLVQVDEENAHQQGFGPGSLVKFVAAVVLGPMAECAAAAVRVLVAGNSLAVQIITHPVQSIMYAVKLIQVIIEAARFFAPAIAKFIAYRMAVKTSPSTFSEQRGKAHSASAGAAATDIKTMVVYSGPTTRSGSNSSSSSSPSADEQQVVGKKAPAPSRRDSAMELEQYHQLADAPREYPSDTTTTTTTTMVVRAAPLGTTMTTGPTIPAPDVVVPAKQKVLPVLLVVTMLFTQQLYEDEEVEPTEVVGTQLALEPTTTTIPAPVAAAAVHDLAAQELELPSRAACTETAPAAVSTATAAAATSTINVIADTTMAATQDPTKIDDYHYQQLQYQEVSFEEEQTQQLVVAKSDSTHGTEREEKGQEAPTVQVKSMAVAVAAMVAAAEVKEHEEIRTQVIITLMHKLQRLKFHVAALKAQQKQQQQFHAVAAIEATHRQQQQKQAVQYHSAPHGFVYTDAQVDGAVDQWEAEAEADDHDDDVSEAGSTGSVETVISPPQNIRLGRYVPAHQQDLAAYARTKHDQGMQCDDTVKGAVMVIFNYCVDTTIDYLWYEICGGQ